MRRPSRLCRTCGRYLGKRLHAGTPAVCQLRTHAPQQNRRSGRPLRRRGRGRNKLGWLPVRWWPSSMLRADFTQAQGFFLQVRSNGLAGYPRQSKIKMLQYLV